MIQICRKRGIQSLLLIKDQVIFCQNRLNTQSLQTNILNDPDNDEIAFFQFFFDLHIKEKKLIFNREEMNEVNSYFLI